MVVATHADQALRLLADPSEDERRLLGAFRYSRNRACAPHRPRVAPAAERAWASWNMDLLDCGDPSRPIGVTYHVNRLQSLPGPTPFSVTLNEPAPARGRARRDGVRPPDPRRGRDPRPEGARRLSGQRGTFYAGAHLRYGFHEDGLLSAVKVAETLGCRLGGDAGADQEAA